MDGFDNFLLLSFSEPLPHGMFLVWQSEPQGNFSLFVGTRDSMWGLIA